VPTLGAAWRSASRSTRGRGSVRAIPRPECGSAMTIASSRAFALGASGQASNPNVPRVSAAGTTTAATSAAASSAAAMNDFAMRIYSRYRRLEPRA
jgi:hypothetical protein